MSSPDTGLKKKIRTAAPQPTNILHVEGALLKLETVRALTGRGRTSIYRDVKAGTFPSPVKFGDRCTRWRADDIRQWIVGLSNC